MAQLPEHLNFAEFPPATREQWLALVERTLKGAPFEKKLVARSYDSLRIDPVYERQPEAQPIRARPAGAPWHIIQRIELPDAAAANAEALHELENGAGGLSLVFAGAAAAYGYGISPAPDALARLLDGVMFDGARIDLQNSQGSIAAVNHLAELVTASGVAPDKADIRFGINPIGGSAASGRSAQPWSNTSIGLVRIIEGLAGRGFKGPFAVSDGRLVHNAGGSEAQELAFALAGAVAYLRALEAGGIALATARDMIYFRLSADADQFMTIAKFRAIRRLWERVQTASGLTAAPGFVAAETAWRMMSRRDPWVNMLRATISTFAAGLGGADAVTVLPFTAAIGLPDRFARRIARNTQLILIEESNLARVGDPAAGSGAIETITDELCRSAWSLFQVFERVGGIWAALERGLVQRDIAEVRDARRNAIAHRNDALTGTSEFPDIHEAPVTVLDMAPIAPTAATLPEVFEALPCLRLAEPFEALRDRSDAILTRTGARPKVFLANLGSVADFTARAMFAKNLFEAGGIEAVTNDGFADHAAMTAAFKASGAKLACLCSSDAIYAREGVAAAKALDGGVLFLAGRPGDLATALADAGVSDFIYAGCDVLGALSRAYDALGAI
jgi:methylmalonyl-CoA mutase